MYCLQTVISEQPNLFSNSLSSIDLNISDQSSLLLDSGVQPPWHVK